ncbi:MAG TPA: hypothetical protein VNN18_03945 [Candidatus Xenobia bacterium]|nr:hypothetical protein [Candidatus Xenobia bacterium]
MRSSGRASQGRYPGLAILAFLCWLLAAAPAAAQDVKVTSANPPAAEQGTVNLDVVIGGSGFKKGAVARFLVTGTEDPGGITVNSTTFKNSGELIANITVADNAPVSKFDIEVTNTNGRRGKGIELFAVVEKGSLNNATQTLVRADFADTSGQRIRSDGQATPCGYDYVDFSDPCTGSVDSTGEVIPNAEQATDSLTLSDRYWLRMVPGCCVPSVNSEKAEWEQYVAEPSRWLVLDFSDRVGGSSCLNIDQEIADAVGDTDWSALTTADGSPLPTPVPPVPNSDPCVDHLIVRFPADHAFLGDGTASLEILVDEPRAVTSRVKGRKSSGLQWNARYSLLFRQLLEAVVNPISGDTILQTGGCSDCDLADLLNPNGTVIGTYHMPFSVTLRRPQ